MLASITDHTALEHKFRKFTNTFFQTDDID